MIVPGGIPLACRRGDRVNRRKLITLLGGAAAAWPFAARAQQSARLPTIGFLGANTPSAQSQWTAAFERRLRELGWIEGRNVAIEYRWAESRFERSPEIIAEFIRLKVDVIVTHGTVNVVAAKAATTVIPIVFAAVADPVGNNLVAGLARPGGNVTGLSAQIPDLAGKRLEPPGDLPVEQPTKFDLIINLTAAKLLGLEIPPTLLARADEVIE
jgi:putative tryptophan/tyrosine transport system substrate-binding protein